MSKDKGVDTGGAVRIRLPHLKKILDLMVTNERQVDIPLIYGSPGVGKTESIEDWMKERNLRASSKDPRDGNWGFSTIILSQYDPTELKGFPYVDEDGEFRFAPIHSLPEKGPWIIFFDELSTSNKEVQNVILRLFSQRELGDYTVPPNVYMVCAANHHMEVGVFTHKLSTAMKTRVATYHLEATYEDWRKWAKTHDVDPTIVYFLQGHQEFLLSIEPDNDSMCTPRTWYYLSEQIKRLRELGYYKDMKVLYPEMVGRVGGAAAAKLQTWIEVYSRVDTDEILKHGRYPSDIGEVNGGFAVTGALVTALKSGRYKLDTNLARNFIGCVKKMPEEFSVCLIGDLMKETRFLSDMRKALKGTSDRAEYEKEIDRFITLLEDDS